MEQKQKYLKLSDIYDQITIKTHQPHIYKTSSQQNINNKSQLTKSQLTKSKLTKLQPSQQTIITNHQYPLQLTNLNLINGPTLTYINQLQSLYSTSQSQRAQNKIDQISLASQRNKQYFTQSNQFFLQNQNQKKGIYLTIKKVKLSPVKDISPVKKISPLKNKFIDEDQLLAEPIGEQKIAQKVRHIWA